MSSYLSPKLAGELRGVSVLGLAHIGDAVFELMVRTWLCTQGTSKAKNLHDESVSYVSAKAQAAAAKRIIPQLSADEFAVYKRGRNAFANNIPRGSSFEEYHVATGLEALIGHLYLSGQTDRLDELFEIVIERS